MKDWGVHMQGLGTGDKTVGKMWHYNQGEASLHNG